MVTIARNIAAPADNPVHQPRVVVGTVMSTTLNATNTALIGIANESLSNRAEVRRGRSSGMASSFRCDVGGPADVFNIGVIT